MCGIAAEVRKLAAKIDKKEHKNLHWTPVAGVGGRDRDQRCVDLLIGAGIDLLPGTRDRADAAFRARLAATGVEEQRLHLSSLWLMRSKPGQGLQKIHIDAVSMEKGKRMHAFILYCTDAESTRFPLLSDAHMAVLDSDEGFGRHAGRLLQAPYFRTWPVKAGACAEMRCNVHHSGMTNIAETDRWLLYALYSDTPHHGQDMIRSSAATQPASTAIGAMHDDDDADMQCAVQASLQEQQRVHATRFGPSAIAASSSSSSRPPASADRRLRAPIVADADVDMQKAVHMSILSPRASMRQHGSSSAAAPARPPASASSSRPAVLASFFDRTAALRASGLDKYELQSALLAASEQETTPFGSRTVATPPVLPLPAVRASSRFPCLQGAFATRAYADGEIISNVPGAIMYESDFANLPFSIPTAAATFLRGARMETSSENNFLDLVIDPTSPVAQMNAPKSIAKANVRLSKQSGPPIGQRILDSFFTVRAIGTIRSGDELFLTYGALFWKQASACDICLFKHDQGPAGDHFDPCVFGEKGCSGGYHSSCWRAAPRLLPHCCSFHAERLSAAAVSYDPTHISQLSNLLQFISVEAAWFELSKYATWTDLTSEQRMPVRLAPSQLIKGILGVHGTQPVKEGTCILPYPGVIMYDEQERRLQKKYHVPTTVQLRDLDYYVDDATAAAMGLDEDKKTATAKDRNKPWLVQCVLVGDPTRDGALMNSPFKTGAEANCLLGHRQDWKKFCSPAPGRKGKGKKVSVSSSLVFIQRLALDLEPTAEYLVSYDDSDKDAAALSRSCSTAFWAAEQEDHCITCHIRFVDGDSSAANIMYACSYVEQASKERCGAHRHQRCFEPGNTEYRAADWYCPLHERAVGFPISSSAASSATQLTPPPRARPIERLFRALEVTPPHLLRASAEIERNSRRSLQPLFEIVATAAGTLPPPTVPSAMRVAHSRLEIDLRAAEPAPAPPAAAFSSAAVSLPRTTAAREPLINHSSACAPAIHQPSAAAARSSPPPRPLRQAVTPPGHLAASRRIEELSRRSLLLPAHAADVPAVASSSASSLRDAPAAPPRPSDAMNGVRPLRAPASESIPFDPGDQESEAEDNDIRLDVDDRYPDLFKDVHTDNASSSDDASGGDASGDSDAAASDSSGQDSDDDSSARQDSLRLSSCMPGSKRAAAAEPLQRPVSGAAGLKSLSLHRAAEQSSVSFTVNEAGRAEILKVWDNYRPAIKKHVKRASFGLVDKKTDAEIDVYCRNVADALSLIHNCCGKDINVGHDQAHRINFDRHFGSPAALVESRLQFYGEYQFQAKKGWYKALRIHVRALAAAQERGEAKPRIIFLKLPFCISCMSRVVDRSRSTVYKSITGSDAPASFESAEAAGPKRRSKVQRVAQYIRMLCVQQGAYNPTDMGSGKGAELSCVVLQYNTQDDVVRAIEEIIGENKMSRQLEFSKTTVQRALAHMKAVDKVHVNIKKSKSLAQCSKCAELQDNCKRARKDGDPQLVRLAKMAFTNHINEAGEQRQLFQEKKDSALACPWHLMVITLDGMDTAKTGLPHICRGTHDARLDYRLDCRVVGAFCYGGPRPCMALTSFDHVQSKGGNAAVTNLERMLRMQWEVMDTDQWATIPDKPFKTRASVDPPLVLPLPPPPDAEPDPLVKVPFMWPAGLHLTFDNTSGDNKNSTFFNFCGLLVALGVFMYVSLSMLMVGHTHDIVDQMFSVWARQLKNVNVVTLKKLHVMFRANYASKIYELKELSDRLRKQDGVAGGTTSGSKQVAAHLVHVAAALRVQPHVFESLFAIDADAWLPGEKLPDISRSYVFRIVKEVPIVSGGDGRRVEDGDAEIVIYTRHLACSTNDEHVPNKRFLVDGEMWSGRRVMFKASVINGLGDPRRRPARPIDLAPIKACIDAALAVGKMEEEDHKEFNDVTIAGIYAAEKQLTSVCKECAKLVAALAAVGVIHRVPEGAGLAERKTAKEQNDRKTEAQRALAKHAEDAAYADAHKGLVEVGWWTDWVARVRDVIRPYYEERGLISTLQLPEYSSAGRMPHPEKLMSDKGAAPFFNNRVEREVGDKLGPPVLGDWVVCKGSGDAANPIWVGKIVKEYGSVEAEPASAAEAGAEPEAEAEAEAEPAKKGGKRRKGGKGGKPVAAVKKPPKGQKRKPNAGAVERAAKAVKMYEGSAARSGLPREGEEPAAEPAAAADADDANPDYLIQWSNFVESTSIPMDPVAWETFMRKVNDDEAAAALSRLPVAAQAAAAAAAASSAAAWRPIPGGTYEKWQAAVELINKGERFERLPEQVIDRLMKQKYGPMKGARKEDEYSRVNKLAIPIYGPKDKLIKSTGELTRWAFKRIKEDWVEIVDREYGMQIDHGAEHERLHQLHERAFQ